MVHQDNAANEPIDQWLIMRYHTRQIKSERTAQLKAAALKYNAQNDSAPVVKAKGAGVVAEKIIQTAREHNVPIKEDADLVELLVSLILIRKSRPKCTK